MTLAIVLSACGSASAQFGGDGAFGTTGGAGGKSDVEVSASLSPVNATTVDVQVTVQLPQHHYIYSTNPKLGSATKISITPSAGSSMELDGPIRADREPKKVNDQYLGPIEKFYDKVVWTQRLRSKGGPVSTDFSVTGELKGMYCSGGEHGTCRPIRPAKKFTASMPAGDTAGAIGPAGNSATPTAIEEPEPGQSVAASESNAPVADDGILVVPEIRGGKKSPIRYHVSLAPPSAGPGDHISLKIRAEIDQPYHTYSTTLDPEAPAIPTEIIVNRVNGAAAVWDDFKPSREPEIKQEGGEKLEVYHDRVEWTQEYVVSGEGVDIEGTIIFQVCNESGCLPPAETDFRISTGELTAIAATEATADASEETASASPTFGEEDAAGLWAFIISAVGFGFVALLTPCVFPMIPVTIAFFLKQGEERPGKTLSLAIVYCLSIVAAFTILGLVMAVVFGPTSINQLANSPWLNLVLTGIFTFFALMLMGMFEVRVPSWLLTWSSKKQENGGYAGVIFMALTFTLVSFTCTFAFVGQLMVWAAQGDYLMPVIGMVAFATAFASPFFFLALFPSLLKQMPKSGGWMNSVKVTMGLLELAIVTKFLSVADTGLSPTGLPQYLDYHLVMGSWIAIATVTGLYLLGMFHMPHDTPGQPVGAVRCLFSVGFLGLAAYIAVGLFSAQAPQGALWKQIVAFAPPQLEVSASDEGYFVEHDGLKYSLDFDAAVKTASTENKPLFLDFTGVNCINCRRMEDVLAQDRFHQTLEGLVRAQLYVDLIPGLNEGSEDHDRILSRNHSLQEDWFADVTIPAYVIATPDGKEILATFKGLDTSGKQFQEFLNFGLDRWKNLKSESNDGPLHAVSTN